VQITASKIKIDYLLDMEPPESIMPAGFSSWDKIFVILTFYPVFYLPTFRFSMQTAK
jgi:hypothetical protein